jgi:TAT (twin-arginine translocation) pathway signal sequence
MRLDEIDRRGFLKGAAGAAAVGAAIGIPKPASAKAKWVETLRYPDENDAGFHVYYLDTDSIVQENPGVFRIWMKNDWFVEKGTTVSDKPELKRMYVRDRAYSAYVNGKWLGPSYIDPDNKWMTSILDKLIELGYK